MKLYFNPKSRAVIAKWMLDECGASYDIVPIDFQKREHKTPEFLKINPAGKLPALVDGDARLFETAAIGLYLAEKFPETGLAPLVGSARTRALSVADGVFHFTAGAFHGRQPDETRYTRATRLERL
ncbi:glutathione S-transferase [Polaromonas sp. P1(28)-13]|nr:glutathione S-transferase [Polaromonas sp. P1(28)-13]